MLMVCSLACMVGQPCQAFAKHVQPCSGSQSCMAGCKLCQIHLMSAVIITWAAAVGAVAPDMPPVHLYASQPPRLVPCMCHTALRQLYVHLLSSAWCSRHAAEACQGWPHHREPGRKGHHSAGRTSVTWRCQHQLQLWREPPWPAAQPGAWRRLGQQPVCLSVSASADKWGPLPWVPACTIMI